jgi:hypothetical protein
MKAWFLGLVLALLAPSLALAEDFKFQGTVAMYHFDSFDISTGEIVWTYGEKYTFLDSLWFRIEDDNSRHEYKYQVSGDMVVFDSNFYAIVKSSEKELWLIRLYDKVGDAFRAVGSELLMLTRE